MKKIDNLKKPSPDSKDTRYAIIKGGISSIPVLGGAAAEIFSRIITPPLEKRRDKWIESIVEKLEKLEENVETFSIEDLINNDAFVTTLLHASQIAIRTHQMEKLNALRNTISNTAIKNAPDEDVQLMFLNFIDIFTQWHLRILKFCNDPEKWWENEGLSIGNILMTSRSMIITKTFPALKGKLDFLSQIFRDLYSRGLIKISDEQLNIGTSVKGLFKPITTNSGKKFLTFISNPIL